MSNKIKRIETDPFDFRGSTKAELGYGNEVVRQRFFQHTTINGQQLGVYETKPHHIKNDDMQTIIMPASHDYRIEPLWMTRADIIASTSHSRVVLVDTPGTTGLLKAGENGWSVYGSTDTLEGSNQTYFQLANAALGNFLPHAHVQFEAIQETIGVNKDDKLVLYGESMGASVAVDMLMVAQEQELDVQDVVLYEAVNMFKGYKLSTPAKLMKVLPTVENDLRNKYFSENAAIGHHITAFELASPDQAKLDAARKSIGQQAISSLFNGIGMARGILGKLSHVLSETSRSDIPTIRIVRGGESAASSEEDYLLAEDALAASGVEVDLLSVIDRSGLQAIGHSHSVSLGRQRQIAEQLFS